MSATMHPIMIEDDLLSVGSISDLSFVAGSMDDFFDIDFPPSKEPLRESPSPDSPLHMQPRIVSVESMSQVGTSSKRSSSPLESLKELAKKKQEKSGEVRKKRSSPSSSCTSKNFFASILSKPSGLLLHYDQSDSCQQEAPATKKRRLIFSSTEKPSTLGYDELHQCCRRGSQLTVDVVNEILARDPTAALRPISLKTTKKTYNPIAGRMEAKVVPELYQYPLNLAIRYQASYEVLECLVSAAPSVLGMEDGKSRSLNILLRHKPADTKSCGMILLKQHDSAEWVDSKDQLALHVAVLNAASFESVKHLVAMKPAALLHRNKLGQTPLDIAQRHSHVCSIEVSDFLWQTFESLF